MILSETFAKPLQSNYSPAPRQSLHLVKAFISSKPSSCQSLHLVQGRPMVIAATLSAI